jgi:isoleucyl-tRNA synthetase
MIKKYGADVLRLWVSSEDYTEDVSISEEMLNRMSEAYRRIRNTFRFILGNLSDFDPGKDRVEQKDFLPIDQWAWKNAKWHLWEINGAYERYSFTRVFHVVDYFFSVILSACYFDILKDRLYTFGSASKERRAAQTVLYDILKSYVVVVAPILSFTSEEIWQSLSSTFKKNVEKSVFEAPWPSFELEEDPELNDEWEKIFSVKRALSKNLEGLRQTKTIGSSLEAEVELFTANEKIIEILKKHRDNLRYYFLVSKVELKEGNAPEDALEAEDANLKMKTVVRKSGGQKCARCWNYYPLEQLDKTFTDICHRCGPVVKKAQSAGTWTPT